MLNTALPHHSPVRSDHGKLLYLPVRRPGSVHNAPRTLTMQDVKRNERHMRSLARHLTHSLEDAEDLVQDTLLAVFRRPRKIRGDQATGYLLRALRNTWISNYRQHKRDLETEPLSDHYEPVATSAEFDPVCYVADQEALAAVQTLPPAYRDVVLAVVIHGLTYSQAAAALDVPIGTIMSRLYRARRLLPMAIDYAA